MRNQCNDNRQMGCFGKGSQKILDTGAVGANQFCIRGAIIAVSINGMVIIMQVQTNGDLLYQQKDK